MPVHIDYEKCNGCKICYEICPMDVFGWDEEKKLPYLVHADECQHRGSCYFECPMKCIDLTLPVCLW